MQKIGHIPHFISMLRKGWLLRIGAVLMRRVCLVNDLDERCANNKRFEHPTLARYLQKFVSIWAALPKANQDYRVSGNSYVRNCLKAMNFEVKTQAHSSAIENFEELVNYFDLSLREIEKSLTNFAIIYNATDEANLNSEYLLLTTFICIIKVIEPGIYQKLSHKKMDYEELLNKAELAKLKAKYWHD